MAEKDASTEGQAGLLGYRWRVGDITAERAERLNVPRWSIVGRDPNADWMQGPQVVLSVSNNVAVGEAIANVVVDALNAAEAAEVSS